MADYGRISSVVPEVVVNVPSGDSKGRVSSVAAEVAVNVPAGDAKARISSVAVETAINVPTGDAEARIYGALAEAVVNETGDQARVAFILVEVATDSPNQEYRRRALGGGIQGSMVKTGV